MILDEFLGLQGPDENLHEYMEAMRDEYPDATASDKARRYAVGDFENVVDADAREILGGTSTEENDPTEAVIGKCLAQIASRIRFRSFQVEDEKAKKFLEGLVIKNRFPKKVTATSYQQMIDGSTAMSVSWQNGKNGRKGRPIVHNETWWNGTYGLFTSVDDSGDVEWALREWRGRDKHDYRTLYLDDVIIRYMKEDEGWTVIDEIDWMRPDGKTPIGIPIAHFPNGETGFGPYPPSTVKQVMTNQDALNRTLFFRQAAAALTGMQVYWGTGVAEDEDHTPRAGSFWSTPNPEAHFGSIAAGSLESLHKEVDDLRGMIAGAFPVPSYRITGGDWPAGIALQRADNPMLAVASQLIDIDKPGCVHIAHRAVELHNIFGDKSERLNEDAWITADFESPESVDPGTQVEVDQALVNLYASLADLPDALLKAANILEAKVADALIAERKAEREVMANAMAQTGIPDDEE